MLIESTFRIGGVICLAAGAALLGAYISVGLLGSYLELLLGPILFFLLGGIFLYVGEDAHRSRLELLNLGDSSTGSSLVPPPRSRP